MSTISTTTDPDRVKKSCIYCPRSGPFTDEHVISAGLGGDDSRWLLKNCVCGHCNTNVFSKIEAKVLRASPIAIARLFLQSRTRDGGTPSIQTQVSFFEEEQSKLLLEQELRAGGQPVVLQQLLFVPPSELVLVGVDIEAAKAFMRTLTAALSDDFLLVEKVREGNEARYYLTRLVWQDDFYVATSREGANKPPATEVIWFEPAVRPVTTAEDFTLPPRVYQRTTGQVVCRSNERDDATLLLTIFRMNLATLAIPDRFPLQATRAPRIHLGLSADFLKPHDRFLVKTGINLCAYLFGADFVRDPAFDRARRYTRTGDGAVYKVPDERAAAFQHVFGPPFEHHHVLMLWPGPGKAHEKACAVLLSRFYGGPIESTRLAEFDGPAPKLGCACCNCRRLRSEYNPANVAGSICGPNHQKRASLRRVMTGLNDTPGIGVRPPRRA
jgi:hypothetical protein